MVSLTDLGFSSLGERVYLALVDSHDAGPTDLAGRFDRTVQEVFAALDELVELGVAKRMGPTVMLLIFRPSGFTRKLFAASVGVATMCPKKS